MERLTTSRLSCVVSIVFASFALAAIARAADEAPAKAPPERTYSREPYVHHIVLLDEDGTPIRPAKPGEESAGAPASVKPVSLAKTCGKCHSDYDTMKHGWHFDFSEVNAPHGRPGEPWIWTDVQTRTQIPLSYRPWPGTFRPYDVGLNDFNFARIFGRHHTGGGALQSSNDLRFKMSGLLEIDCLICHVSDGRYNPVARAQQIGTDQNFKYAPTLAAFLGKVQGSAARLRDNFDPTGADAKRAPKINYDASRFDDLGQVLINMSRRIPNERCYFCHTNVDTGRNPATTAPSNAGLESRWTHDGDIHLAKGMLCVDCHRNGADHMIVRGYEGEFEDRAKAGEKPDRSITTLTCVGCHNGSIAMEGGRNAAPRPIHRGMPTLHFDRLTCTACHSGPKPADATTLVQTAMAHRLGIPRHRTVDDAAPLIQEPVFLRSQRTGKIGPYRMLFPSFWGWMNGETVTPIAPEQVLAAGVDEILGEKPDSKEGNAFAPLTQDQIAQVLEKLAAAQPAKIKPADVISARAPMTATTAPTTSNSGASAAMTTMPATASATPTPAPLEKLPATEFVFVTGGRVYKRGPQGKGLIWVSNPAAEPYTWALAHDVRGAQQALGARGCTECHAGGAPIFDGNVESASLVTAASVTTTMHDLRGDASGALEMFAATYPLRPILIVIGYASAAILALVILKRALRLLDRRE